MIHNETHMPGDIVWTREGWYTIDWSRSGPTNNQMVLRPTTRYELERNGLITIAEGFGRPTEKSGTYVDVTP